MQTPRTSPPRQNALFWVCAISGMLKVSLPFGAFVAFDAIVARFSSRKVRPGFESRTEAAFSTALSVGKPPGSGVVPPQLEQPEHPPPEQDAASKKRRTNER
jgi:hypothetical protein